MVERNIEAVAQPEQQAETTITNGRVTLDWPEAEKTTAPEVVTPVSPKLATEDTVTLGWAALRSVLVALLFFGAGLVFDRFVLLPSAGSGAANGSAATGSGVQPGAGGDASLVTTDDPAWGPADARVTVVEFSDFQCPYCGQFKQQTYNQLRAKYGNKIRFIFRDFPLSAIHPDAEKSAEAANCAKEQGKFWEYHDLLFANQRALSVQNLKQYATNLGLNQAKFNACLDSGQYAQEVASDQADGEANNVRGTPTFFINGRPLVGAQPFSEFQKVIDPQLIQAQ